jgi:hypothetical protein
MQHVHFLEFKGGEKTTYTTNLYDNVHAVLDEALDQRNEILESLSTETGTIRFWITPDPNAPGNAEAIELFDCWMSQFALNAFDPCVVKYQDIRCKLRAEPLRTAFVPSRRQPDQQTQPLMAC